MVLFFPVALVEMDKTRVSARLRVVCLSVSMLE